MSEKINIVLNNKNISAAKGETILDVANRYGIHIPTLCHDPRLEPYSSCFICVVEVEGMRTLQTACSTKITEGMKITTNSEKVRKARKTALELLLSNHYADCVGPCKQACPAGVDVQGYIALIEKEKYSEAIALIKETNPFPAVCGRVCVRPCEVACRRNLLDEGNAVGIDYLKRFAADKDLASKDKYIPEIKERSGKKVAIIGGGPGGFAAAFFLRKEGHDIDLYEASPKAGGWLRYGIPEYRLPNDILQKEIDNIAELGVKIYYNKKLGENLSYKDLQKNYDATVIAIGAQKGTNVGCEGDDADNVFSGIDFLKEMELTGKRYDFSGKTVAVVGGGNTAMDCCRSAIRCQAKKVYVIYRRTEAEMPANPIEIHESKLEGVEYLFLTLPKKITKTPDGKVKNMTCIKMQLGEPDASGRRRPVPIENSDFELDIDIVLAAIGQKTTVNFIEDINKNSGKGELKLTKWGDVEAHPETLQTSIPSIFAAGDCVTGPATLIQAIGQAKIAALSCHQFITGQPIIPTKKEFISKRDNFKKQDKKDYVGKYAKQLREEMPVLPTEKRNNFNEVELGYTEEMTAHEVNRCLECGCTEYFDCDLRNYSTEYQAVQGKYKGKFNEFNIDFRHPFIEIDNNKCILCGRCVRICKEVVGADALGLIKRGFETYVAPSMGKHLQDTYCESCGLCISACPTGGITENTSFKPGPIKTDQTDYICNYCGVGCTLTLHHKGGFAFKITGNKGHVNKDGNLCKYGKFGYSIINHKTRITQPLLKKDGKFIPLTFDEAFDIIKKETAKVQADENYFFAGSRLTNEEIFLIQKIARAALKTNNIASFHYFGQANGYIKASILNTPFEQIQASRHITLLGAELNKDNGVIGFMVYNHKYFKHVPLEIITTREKSSMQHKADNMLQIKSYYYFIKALNYWFIAQNKINALFINDNCDQFDAYKNEILKEKYEDLILKSGISKEDLEKFAENWDKTQNAIIIASEKELSSEAVTELHNLAMLSGKLGKTAMGIIVLKEKNNAQGLIDMGAFPELLTGNIPINDETTRQRFEKKWNLTQLPKNSTTARQMLTQKKIKNLFIFGEDPIGCAKDKKQMEDLITPCNFIVVQDYFLTETAKTANLVLPASFPFEIGGSFSNTQKNIQKFDFIPNKKIEKNSLEQLSLFLEHYGINTDTHYDDIMMEIISLLPDTGKEEKLTFEYTAKEQENTRFEHGCDAVVKYFNELFLEKINTK